MTFPSFQFQVDRSNCKKARNTESIAKLTGIKIYHFLCEAVDQYALQWAKREMVELSVLSSWKEMVKGQTEERISKVKQNFEQPIGKVLQNADIKACLSDLHNKYVFVPADKAPNNMIICKNYYIKTLIKELGLYNCSTPTGNSTYTSC